MTTTVPRLLLFFCAVAIAMSFFVVRPPCRTIQDLRKIRHAFVVDHLLSPADCRRLIELAEHHAAANDGWETDRHDDYPTTDLDTYDIEDAAVPVQHLVFDHLIPCMAHVYGVSPRDIGLKETFVAKYTAARGTQRALEPHTDGCEFSFVIPLNDDFEGGGTRFVDESGVRRPPVGSALCFLGGHMKHEGVAVTRGTRYVLIGFLKFKTMAEFDDDD